MTWMSKKCCFDDSWCVFFVTAGVLRWWLSLVHSPRHENQILLLSLERSPVGDPKGSGWKWLVIWAEGANRIQTGWGLMGWKRVIDVYMDVYLCLSPSFSYTIQVPQVGWFWRFVVFSVLMNVVESSTGNNPSQKICHHVKNGLTLPKRQAETHDVFRTWTIPWLEISNDFFNEASRKSRKNTHTSTIGSKHLTLDSEMWDDMFIALQSWWQNPLLLTNWGQKTHENTLWLAC